MTGVEQPPRHEGPLVAEQILGRHAGLKETLWALCDPHGLEGIGAPLPFAAVIEILAHDRHALWAARAYLSGEGARRDAEAAHALGDKIAWGVLAEAGLMARPHTG